MSGRIKLVVFDVGSVLVEAGRTLAEDITLAGFFVDAAWLSDFEPRLARLPRPNVGAITVADYAPLFAAVSGGMFSADDALRIASHGLVAEYPGIAEVFDALDAAGVETALLCNVHDREWERLLPRDGVKPEFPTVGRARHRFASHLVGARKPDPRTYAAVESGTGRRPEQIVFFDDREENVLAARDRGWTADVIDHLGDTAGQLMARLRYHGVIS